MKRHTFSLHLTEGFHEVIKNSKQYLLPSKTLFLDAFIQEISRICNDDPEEIAKILRKICIEGLKIEVGEIITIGISPTSEQGESKKEQEKQEEKTEVKPEEKEEDVIKKASKKIEEMFDLS
jgi:flagellar biosynthesis/type III secretory pathway M-ring protein FliF/YscJ